MFGFWVNFFGYSSRDTIDRINHQRLETRRSIRISIQMQDKKRNSRPFVVSNFTMTERIYRSEFEAMKAPHIMRRRVSYISNGETVGQ